MLGLGETKAEVIEAMHDLRDAEVDALTLGQYLRPSKANIDVKEYVNPQEFDWLRTEALRLGFVHVAAGPFVRSSYRAFEFLKSRNERM
jgi:lipoic acid synthetase